MAVAPMLWSVGTACGQEERENQIRNQGRQNRQLQDQEQQQFGQPGQPGRPGAAGPLGANVSDQELAAWLLIDNIGEIKFSQFGQEQTDNPQVRDFAQQMIEDHSQMVQKLQPFAGGGQPGQPGQPGIRQPGARPGANLRPGAAGRENDAEARREVSEELQEVAQIEDRDDARRGQAQPGAQVQPGALGQEGQPQERTARRPIGPAAGVPGGSGLIAFHAQVSQQALQAKQQMLQDKEGAQFDVAFMSDQVSAHLKEVATLRVAQQHAQSPQLKQLLQQAEQTTQQHLKQAVALLRQVEQREDGAGGASGAAPRRQGNRRNQEQE